MKRPLISLLLCAVALGLTVGCLYPEREHRREQGPESRHEERHDDHHDHNEGREHPEQR